MISNDRYYTWVDVESKFQILLERGEWPANLAAISCYSDGIYLETFGSPGNEPLHPWLISIFGPRVNVQSGRLQIALDGVFGDQVRTLDVFIEVAEGEREVPLRLLFDSANRIARPSIPVGIEPTQELPIFALHSFKGGVGRTTSAIALALEITRTNEKAKKRSVLLIDADMEAPGITFLLEERIPDLPVSFADFLALANECRDTTRAVKIVAEGVRGLDFDGILVLPAFRNGEGYESVGVRPEHLIRNSTDPFVLSRLMRDLGAELNVDAIIVDLRAGISEISSGLLLDPTVKRVFVSTLGGQSLRGTRSMLSKVARRGALIDSRLGVVPQRLHLVFSQVREEDKESHLPQAVSYLTSGLGEQLEEGTTPGLSVVGFSPSLTSMGRSWADSLHLIAKSLIGESLRGIADNIFATSNAANTGIMSIDAKRQELSTHAQRLEYAETGEGEEFLVTAALRNFASDHLSQVPIVPVVGQKGAGKSYTFLQLVKSGAWGNFVRATTGRVAEDQVPIFPLLEPGNLKPGAQEITEAARKTFCKSLGTVAKSQISLRDMLRDAVAEKLHEGEWRLRWLALMCQAVGLGEHSTLDDLVASLDRSESKRVIFVVDGLEDVFQDLHQSSAEQVALRSLLQDTLTWLSQIPRRPVGLVVFVRRDMVVASIRQNFAQLLNRYQPYELRWDRTEALRLVLWMTRESLETSIPDESSGELSEEYLSELLSPLWGLKLGARDAREAYSAEWVLAALSDFRGQVQARDVVRLVRVAAQLSVGDVYWSDRILTPQALRKSLVTCGLEKVQEIEQETPRLKPVFDSLRALPHAKRVIPFDAGSAGLSVEEVELLDRGGILLREPDGYYMPEMFRLGLGFSLPKGARPRVLALSRRVRGSS